MQFTEEQAAKALRDLGIDFAREDFTLPALVAGMNAELRHGRKARGTNLTNDDPTMTAMLAVNNLRVSPSYYSGRVGKSAWERSLSRGVKHRGGKTEVKTIDFEGLLDLRRVQVGDHTGYDKGLPQVVIRICTGQAQRRPDCPHERLAFRYGRSVGKEALVALAVHTAIHPGGLQGTVDFLGSLAHLADLQVRYQAAVDAGELGASSRVAEIIRDYQRSERVRLKDVPSAYRVS